MNILISLVSLTTSMKTFWAAIKSSTCSIASVPSGNSTPPKIDSMYLRSKIETFVTFVFAAVHYAAAVLLRTALCHHRERTISRSEYSDPLHFHCQSLTVYSSSRIVSEPSSLSEAWLLIVLRLLYLWILNRWQSLQYVIKLSLSRNL